MWAVNVAFALLQPLIVCETKKYCSLSVFVFIVGVLGSNEVSDVFAYHCRFSPTAVANGSGVPSHKAVSAVSGGGGVSKTVTVNVSA
ncbi:MAG: hypothetical protein M9931_03455 [Chitinophagales bacterium]|nr:hypothetical protein [Chitinophagales bacterium]